MQEESFAVPAIPPNTAGGGYDKRVTGKNIFQKQHENPNSNQSRDLERKMKNLKHAGFDQNMRKIPTGVQAPKPSDSLPPKKISPVEPDAVPLKTYDAILLNKEKEKASLGGEKKGLCSSRSSHCQHQQWRRSS